MTPLRAPWTADGRGACPYVSDARVNDLTFKNARATLPGTLRLLRLMHGTGRIPGIGRAADRDPERAGRGVAQRPPQRRIIRP